MVIDSSALTAILFGETEAMSFAKIILAEPVRLMSAANALETEIVAMRKLGQDIGTVVRVLVDSLAIAIVPVTADQYRIAAQAYRSYGKGFHPAALNYGDLFAYALAKATGEKLLFKGNDFSLTDIGRVAMA